MNEFEIVEWQTTGDSADEEITMLAEILQAVVYGGAGVSFFVPFSMEEAHAFWTNNVLPAMREGTRRVRRDGKTTPAARG